MIGYTMVRKCDPSWEDKIIKDICDPLLSEVGWVLYFCTYITVSQQDEVGQHGGPKSPVDAGAAVEWSGLELRIYLLGSPCRPLCQNLCLPLG